ncbi:ferredoxin [Mycolicibacterium sp.]|uniref:ferredoxin n=1 Tax=Mycolicibacterium sp. TaxID=2320850 RepID=UPI001A246FAD|nr:ferredoxin [Mycolicibacterium sp.]MBJ7337552.1 ferredoxin [Mycolicibacterium sp.]
MSTACRIVFDRSKCATMGLCEMVAPDVFHIDDDGVMTVQSDTIDASRRTSMEEIAMACPTQSLSVVDA